MKTSALKPLVFGSTRQKILKQYGDSREEPPPASRYVHHLEALVSQRRNLIAVLWIRASGREQRRRKNLRDQEASLRRNVAKRGVKVIHAFRAVASGWDEDRGAFKQAAAFARRHHGAILVAESSDRFLRNRRYSSSQNPSAQPTRAEWKSLLRVTHGVELATLLHPDTDWREVRSYQSKRGILQKGARCGRPRNRRPGEMKERRESRLDRALYLRHSWPLSYRAIGEELGVPWRTVVDWLRPFEPAVCGF